MRRKTVGDRLVDVPDTVFACDFSDDPDPLARACAPEQPETVEVGQQWMCVETGQTYPVKDVNGGGVDVDLGSDSYTILTEERFLRRDYVCVDAPDNVTKIAPAARPERIPYDEPQTWYFTFGSDHQHPNGYIRFDGFGGSEAREAMVARFGRAWAFQYDAHDWFKHGVSQAEKYRLTEVE